MMTNAYDAIWYKLITDYIDFLHFFYTARDMTSNSNIFQARISLPRLFDVNKTPQRNNALAAQAQIRNFNTP